MTKFHETRMGVRFYEAQVPELLKRLSDIGHELKR